MTWTSDSPAVASVDQNGTVYANSVGTAVITATTVDGSFTASCTVTVNPAAESSEYQLVDTIESGEEYIIVTYIGGTPYALVNRNANSNGFAAKLIPVILTDNGEFVLAPEDSTEEINDLVWLAEGDYTEGFSFQSITNELFFAGLPYCNWTAINTTQDRWVPMEHTTADGSIITILQSVRALTVNEDDEKYYIGTTTAYYNSAIYDYVRLSDACEVLFFKHVTGSEIMLGDVNGDEIVNIADAALILRYSIGLLSFDDTQLLAADVNGDGNVNTVDAALILRNALGL